MTTPADDEIVTPHENWHRMDLREFHENGLLAQANAAFFWPLGLALTVVRDTDKPADEEYLELFVQKIEPFEPIVSGASPEEQEARADKLAAWMKGRLA